MTKRLNAKGDAPARDRHGWYVEERKQVTQLADAIDFGNDIIWDPAAGGGTIPDVMSARGHTCIASDIIERPRWGRNPYQFFRGNFLLSTRWPSPRDRRLSIMTNPPYNEPEVGIAEKFIHHALDNIPFHLAAFIVPIEFACGQGRYERLYSRRPPSHLCFYTERPSMPPGEVLLARGEEMRGGGMNDYIAVVWDSDWKYPGFTQTLFLAPTNATPPKPDRQVRRRTTPKG